ncbi:MAG: hypothetical protein ACD_75C02518G0001 [uncultured bacterium]|nr:MAG: hypothetical protein ACD_75C02518G0001 [uncultured bacterium]
MPGQAVDLLLQNLQLLRELLRQNGKDAGIDTDAGNLHIGEDSDNRHLDAPKQVHEVFFLKQRRKLLPQHQCSIYVFATVNTRLFNIDIGKTVLSLIAPRHLGICRHSHSARLTQIVEFERPAPAFGEVCGDQGVGRLSAEFNSPLLLEHRDIVFQIVADFQRLPG